MELLQQLVLSGRIIDIALLVMATELIVLIVMQRRGRIMLDIRGACFNLGAGGSLALAIKAAITSESVMQISAFLIASLIFHGLDTFRRVRPARDEKTF